MSSVNFIGINTVDTVEPVLDLDARMAEQEAILTVDIERTKDCEACREFPVVGYYCKRHTCLECGGFDEYGSYLCSECLPF